MVDDNSELPYIFQRDSVKDNRMHKPLYAHQETIEQERAFRSEIEQELGEEIPKADLREAAYIVAMHNPDVVADKLRSWGYDY